MPKEWTPAERRRPTRREAFEAAKAALAAQGLEMTPFGIATNERVIAGEITDDEAMSLIIAHHRVRNPPQGYDEPKA